MYYIYDTCWDWKTQFWLLSTYLDQTRLFTSSGPTLHSISSMDLQLITDNGRKKDPRVKK